MKSSILMLVLLLAGPMTAGLLTQGAPPPLFKVPSHREPLHDVKLENRYVRVLDVTVPPFHSTLFHIHENPYVFVSIGPATLKAQVEGSKELTDLILKDGEVRYSPEIVHRVANVGTTPFRNITIQIQGRDDTMSSEGPSAASTMASGASLELENELVRVDRLVLEPGQSTGSHTHARSSLLVAVHPGSLRVENAGGPAMTVTLGAGEFDWHTGPRIHTITNIGKSRFEAIEVVWK